MQKSLFSKSLATGIIILFIGVCIHPAFAVENKPSIINKASEDECWNCKDVNDRQLVVLEKLLNRLEIYKKLLLVLSKYNPEFNNIIKKLLDEIKTLKQEFTNDKDPIICDILYHYQEIIEIIGNTFYSFWKYFCENENDLIADFIRIFVDILENRYWWIWKNAYYLQCDWVPPWWIP